MVGLVGMFGWVLVGIIVAGVEKAMGRERPDTLLVSIAGAIAAGFIGQLFRWFVFGEPLGFLCAAIGAELLLSVYRSQGGTRRPAPDVDREMAGAPRASMPASAPSPLILRFAEAIGWGAVCAFAAGAAGLFGQLFGSKLYPQRYEQIPSFLFFLPLGFVLGFITAFVARLARPRWSISSMFGVVIVAAVVYGSMLFEYARDRARPARLAITFEPESPTALPCDSSCPPGDPPPQWMVQGTMHVQETTGLGGSVDAIEIDSNEMPAPGTRRNTKEEIVELNRFRGPHMLLQGRQIPGARRIRRDAVLSFPIKYVYRTRNGDPERTIEVFVEFTDGAGHRTTHPLDWKVR